MEHDLRMQALHDRATRGLPLSDEEQSQLEAWYIAQDNAESALLGVASGPTDPHELQVHIDTAIAQLLATSRQIQELSSQNVTLRAEIADLQQRLRRQPTTHAA